MFYGMGNGLYFRPSKKINEENLQRNNSQYKITAILFSLKQTIF